MDIRAFFLRNKFWLNDWLKGSPIGKPYQEIKFIQTHSMEEGWPLRKQKLHALLDFARKYSTFYKDYLDYDLSAFPVMTKAMLIENHDAIAIAPDNIPGQIGDVFIQRTSGSTGNPLSMPQDTRKRQRRVAEIKFLVKQLGYNSHEKMIHLRTWNNLVQKPADMKKRDNIVPFNISCLGENELLELCHLINEEKAIYVRGYASTFDSISRVAKANHFAFPSLRLIVCTSESLEDDVRLITKEAMECEVVSQYANEECGVLAQERIPTKESDNKMYFNWSGYYIEVLKMDKDEPAKYGEIGRLVLTDFHNYAFPLIRYDTGDTCMLLPPDNYSNGYPVLGKLYGRRFDLTYTTSGTPIYPLTYGRILKNYDSILQWQFIQMTEKGYSLNLVLKDENLSQVEDMKRQIQEILGSDANIEVNFVKEIPVMRSGKRKPVKNEWINN